MRNAVKKIKAKRNTSKKIFGEHIRQFLHKKKKCVTRTFPVLVVQNGIAVMQNNGKKCTGKFVANLLHRQICSYAH